MEPPESSSSKFVTVVVLNDGKTFTDVRGCSLCVIPFEQYRNVTDAGGDASNFTPVVEIELTDIIH